jgi:hypothetical protein
MFLVLIRRRQEIRKCLHRTVFRKVAKTGHDVLCFEDQSGLITGHTNHYYMSVHLQ